jgi:rubrerythrin
LFNGSEEMVKTIRKDGKEIYTCDICGFGYEDKETAESCQEYCSKNKACSLEITQKAVYFPK